METKERFRDIFPLDDGQSNAQWIGEMVQEVFGCCDIKNSSMDYESCLRDTQPPVVMSIHSDPGEEAKVSSRQTAQGRQTEQARSDPRITANPTMAAKSTLPPQQETMTVAAKNTLPVEIRNINCLDEHKALIYANWCIYCLCCGCGSSPIYSPIYMDFKCCCCLERCRTDADTQQHGCSSTVNSCCCCLCACQFPRRVHQPFVKICNIECCSGFRFNRDAGRSAPFSAQHRHDVMQEFCVPCYCCCGGFSLTPGFECCTSHCTCGQCDIKTQHLIPKCTLDSISHGWLGYFCACHHCYLQFRLPFLCKEIPICACCGSKCRQRAP